ncbi:MAG: MATE family efflux transporter [Clostridiales bacterium]|nr:MATE family efflux transporter [Clostridiales bacterium]
MTEQQKLELFERTPVPNAVVKMAVPTVASSLVMVLYSLADTYFVGMLNDPVATAAVTLASPVLLAFNALNNLFGVGSSSLMSRSLGCKDYDTVRRTSALGFYCALFCSLLLSVGCTALKTPLMSLLGADADTWTATANYMFWTVTCGAAPAILNVVLANMVRSEGAAMNASIGTMSGCLLNIVLDPIFILPWGLNMGAAGAGLATFLSNCVACLYFFVLLFVRRGKTFVSVSPKDLQWNSRIFLQICGVGIPAAIQNLLNVTGMTVLNNFTAVYGADAVSAMGIAHKIAMVPMYVAMGVSQGIMPLVSYNYASKGYRRMKQVVLFAGGISLAMMVVGTAICLLGGGPLISLFMENESVVAYGEVFLRGMSLAMPFLGLDFLAVGVFQACGMGRNALVFAILRKVVLEIPALIILNQLWPLYGLAYAQLVAEFVLAIAAVVMLGRIFHSLQESGETAKEPSVQ